MAAARLGALWGLTPVMDQRSVAMRTSGQALAALVPHTPIIASPANDLR